MLTVEQFKDALRVLWPRLHRSKQQMLEYQYHAPNHAITATQLAELVHYNNHGPVNLHYPTIGRRIAKKLGKLPEQRQNGTYRWWNVLSTGIPAGKDGWLWIMRPELALALEELELVTVEERSIPEEVEETEKGHLEGAVRLITVNAYERNTTARNRCVAYHKPKCSICGFDFGIVYGEKLTGYIHVHHLRPLSEIKSEYIVDPIKDLRPVCPNCHAVIHSRKPAYTIEEVQAMLQK